MEIIIIIIIYIKKIIFTRFSINHLYGIGRKKCKPVRRTKNKWNINEKELEKRERKRGRERESGNKFEKRSKKKKKSEKLCIL